MNGPSQSSSRVVTAPVRLIEFDTAVRDAIAELIQLCGLPVKSYFRGCDFLADFENFPTRCVLCASELPDTRGIEVFQSVMAMQPETPFALLVSRRVDATLAEARSARVMQILNKPMIDTDQLLDFVGAVST